MDHALDTLQPVLESLADMANRLGQLGIQLGAALLLAGLLILLGRGLRPVARAVLARKGRPSRTQVFLGLYSTVVAIVAVLLALTFAFPSVQVVDVLGGLGIISVAVGFAFKDILENQLAGVLLVLRDPFRTGDQIRTGSYEGTVQGLTIRETLLQTYDGRHVVIPNSQVYTKPLEVLTHFPDRRAVLRFSYQAGTDPEAIRQAFLPALRAITPPGAPDPHVLVVDGDGKVTVEVRMWAKSTKSAQDIAVDDAIVASLRAAHRAGLVAYSPALVIDEAGEVS